MYDAIQQFVFAATMAVSGQCSDGKCPLQMAAAIATAPVHLAAEAVRGGCSGAARGGCSGRSARFHATARGGCSGTVQARGGCSGQVAALMPKQQALPLPMAPPPVVKTVTTVVEAPVSPVAAPVVVARPKVDIWRPAPVRTFRANRGPFGLFTCP